jgi:hypothetical protein
MDFGDATGVISRIKFEIVRDASTSLDMTKQAASGALALQI